MLEKMFRVKMDSAGQDAEKMRGYFREATKKYQQYKVEVTK